LGIFGEQRLVLRRSGRKGLLVMDRRTRCQRRGNESGCGACVAKARQDRAGQSKARRGEARRDKDSDSVGVRRRDGGRWAPNRGGTLDLGLVTWDFGRGRESVAAVTQRRRPFGAEQAGSEVWLVTSCVAEVGQPGRASLGAAVQPGQQDRRDRAGGTGLDWLGLAGTGWDWLGRAPRSSRASRAESRAAAARCGSVAV
jgi:hypothetical protein